MLLLQRCCFVIHAVRCRDKPRSSYIAFCGYMILFLQAHEHGWAALSAEHLQLQHIGGSRGVCWPFGQSVVAFKRCACQFFVQCHRLLAHIWSVSWHGDPLRPGEDMAAQQSTLPNETCVTCCVPILHRKTWFLAGKHLRSAAQTKLAVATYSTACTTACLIAFNWSRSSDSPKLVDSPIMIAL